MTEPISAEEAIQESILLWDHMHQSNNHDSEEQKTARLMMDALNKVKQFIEQNRWVHVSERLPDSGIDVHIHSTKLKKFEVAQYKSDIKLFVNQDSSLLYPDEIIEWRPIKAG